MRGAPAVESSCNFRVRALSKQGRPGRGTPHMAVPGVRQERAALDQAMLTVSGSVSIIAHPQPVGPTEGQDRDLIRIPNTDGRQRGVPLTGIPHRRAHYSQGAMNYLQS